MKRSVIVGLASLLVAGGVAVAAIPGPDGVIHSCMLKKIGTIRIIDPSQGQKCNDKLETPLGWNQIGRPGTNGTNGTNGADGNSAYQIWLDLGNTGTEQDFIDSLRGPRGNDGADGNLALAGQSCQQGQFVTGFNQAGNIVCGEALPPPPVIGSDCEHLNLVPGADLHNCNLSFADLHNIDLNFANLNAADLNHANLNVANLSHANLTGADLHVAVLIAANLTQANLTQANLTFASAHNANLTGAVLRNANLTSVILTGANLTGANLTGATWSNTTCPDGTNSNDNGGTCMGHL